MLHSTWIQFSWNLSALPPSAPKLDQRYLVEVATLENKNDLEGTIKRAYSMESVWAHDLGARTKLAHQIIEHDFPAGEVSFIAIKHGSRIVGAAAIREAAEKPSHLPLGVCVLNEYRSRGLGTVLLFESLRRLRDRGLEQARLITKKNTTAERYLYPKFNGVRVVLNGNPN